MTDPDPGDKDTGQAESIRQQIGSAGRDAMQVGRDYVAHSHNRTRISLFITAMLVLGGMAAALGLNKIRDVTSSPRPEPSQPSVTEKK